jgi:hypothetical protein
MRKKTNQVDRNLIAEQVANLLTKGYLAWQSYLGEPKTFKEYSDWLEIPVTQLHQYKSGQRIPSIENVHKISRRLGPYIYMILDIQPQDEDLRFVIRNWSFIPKEIKQNIILLVKNNIEPERPGKMTYTPGEVEMIPVNELRLLLGRISLGIEDTGELTDRKEEPKQVATEK